MSDQENQLDTKLGYGVAHFFERIPFNKLVGMELVYVGKDRVDIKLNMKPELIGNYIHGNLHGGVISSVLDVAGGCIAVVGAYERTKGQPEEKRQEVLSKIGTIDMRVDYLRPGRGAWFLATARVLRTGNKVAVTRMELHNDQDDVIALGTGTYLCG